MPNQRGRGRTTQDAHRVLAAEYSEQDASLSIASAGAPDVRVLNFPQDQLGRQLSRAVWSMLPQAGLGGGWASSGTVIGAEWYCVLLHEELTDRGVEGFNDPKLSFADMTRTRSHLKGKWRSFRKAVVWAVEHYHPDGSRLAELILADRLDSTIANPTMAYDEAVAGVIESAAREVFLAWVGAHRRFLADVGVDTSDRNWILLPAEAVLDVASRSGTPAARQLLHYADGGDLDDWTRPAIGASRNDLSATAVLMCLAQNLGPNWASLQSMTGDSVTPLGGAQSVVDMDKTRAATELRVATSTADLSTLGGIATALTGLTRFVRLRRLTQADTPEHRRHADLLFVPTDSRTVLNSPTQSAWAAAVAREAGETVSMRRLRETANIRGKRRTGRGTVIGHSEAMDLVYLVEGTPEEEVAALVLQAQDDIVGLARHAVRRDPVTDAAAVEELATEAPADLIDRGVVTCGNGARDPDQDRWCNRGILACFTCPSGYRTSANVPGLKAAVTLTEQIRAYDADEWQNGPAATLHAYALAALDQLGADHDAVDGTAMIPVVAANYWEIRA